jgi:hypothetical protein
MSRVIVTKRRSLGWIRRLRKPVWMTAVLVDGHTVASFLHEDEADRYIEARFPKRHGKRHS